MRMNVRSERNGRLRNIKPPLLQQSSGNTGMYLS
jgi:hypothetical protein